KNSSASGGRFVFLPTPANPPNPPTHPNKDEARAAAMQQAMPMPAAAAAPGMPPSAGLSTEQIQKYLDENKQLILAILENQNLGKLAECAQYQAQLQKNLLYLAAIADTQPQTSVSRPQVSHVLTNIQYTYIVSTGCTNVTCAYRWHHLVHPQGQGITCHRCQCSLQGPL
uniref:SS18 N-terminal domain-containing protein n=2 Tax=Aegilops tauschii subsp. strangulata TaxID=200361 RepID=A0A453K3P0_AEGTS